MPWKARLEYMSKITKTYQLVLNEKQHTDLKKHLLPADGAEAAAILLCHRGDAKECCRLVTHSLILVPYDQSTHRNATYLEWATKNVITPELITDMDKKGLSFLTIHSHPSGFRHFSTTDDTNDKLFFASANHWFDDKRPLGSAIMLPTGEIIARIVTYSRRFVPIQSVSACGEDLFFWKRGKKERGKSRNKEPAFTRRILQTFGKGTLDVLRQLKIGVVGCSGTGSIVIELLARNCVGKLVLADDDVIEDKNLNRILNSGKKDAAASRPKVQVIGRAIKEMGMGTQVELLNDTTTSPAVKDSLKTCDVLFGCVDSVRGRYHLDVIASAYAIPLFDVGVHIEVGEVEDVEDVEDVRDVGEGGKKGEILGIDMAAHYVSPLGPGLLTRGVYTSEQLAAEDYYHTDRKHYAEQRKVGYLAAVNEDQPAVISVNMQAACMAVNDFLARLHRFRFDDNRDFESQRFSLSNGYYAHANCSPKKEIFDKYRAMGDKSELLNYA